MKLFGSIEKKINKNKNGENVPHLEISEVVLVYCNILNNDYQCNLRVLYALVLNISFGQLLDISPTNLIFFQAFYSEFLYIKVQFTDQNSEELELEDKINITLDIN